MIRVPTPWEESLSSPRLWKINRVKTYEEFKGAASPPVAQKTSNFCHAGLGLTSPAFLSRAREE